ESPLGLEESRGMLAAIKARFAAAAGKGGSTYQPARLCFNGPGIYDERFPVRPPPCCRLAPPTPLATQHAVYANDRYLGLAQRIRPARHAGGRVREPADDGRSQP